MCSYSLATQTIDTSTVVLGGEIVVSRSIRGNLGLRLMTHNLSTMNHCVTQLETAPTHSPPT